MESATQMLLRAIELDSKKKYCEAKICYEEGVEILLKHLQSINDETQKIQIRKKISGYMERAEQLKSYIVKTKANGKFHEKVEIKNNQRGCSYNTLLSKYIDENLHIVCINDAYVRSHHQILNLVRFCELLLKKGKNLKNIQVITGIDDKNHEEQRKKICELATSLQSYGVSMKVEYSETIHDREISFDNGWIIKIGRGLDYFKAPKGKTSVGFCDMDLRECHETVIDVYDTR